MSASEKLFRWPHRFSEQGHDFAGDRTHGCGFTNKCLRGSGTKNCSRQNAPERDLAGTIGAVLLEISDSSIK